MQDVHLVQAFEQRTDFAPYPIPLIARLKRGDCGFPDFYPLLISDQRSPSDPPRAGR